MNFWGIHICMDEVMAVAPFLAIAVTAYRALRVKIQARWKRYFS